jgi:hypothetical protein
VQCTVVKKVNLLCISMQLLFFLLPYRELRGVTVQIRLYVGQGPRTDRVDGVGAWIYL